MWKDKRFAVSLLALTTGHVTGCAVDDTVPPPLVVRDAAAGGNGGAGGKAGSTGSVVSSTSSAVGSGAAGSTGAGGTGVGGNGGSAGAGSGGKGGSAGSAGSTGGSAGAGGRTDGGAGTGGGSAGAATDGGSDSDVVTDASRSDASDAVVEACPVESDTQLCARSQKNCGSFVALDNCGVSRRVLACGTCLGAGAVCGAGGTLNVCPGTDPVNRAQGGTVLSSNPTSPPFNATEGDAKAFDNDAATKWYVRGNATPTIVYDFAGTNAYTITSYTITSGNDAPDRDPASWRLQGSNAANLSTWITVDTRTSQTFAGRGQTNLYAVANPAGFLVYRLEVTANNGNTNLGGEFQVAEIQLFGTPAVVAPDPDAGAGDAGTVSDASAEAADVGTAADAGADAAVD